MCITADCCVGVLSITDTKGVCPHTKNGSEDENGAVAVIHLVITVGGDRISTLIPIRFLRWFCLWIIDLTFGLSVSLLSFSVPCSMFVFAMGRNRLSEGAMYRGKVNASANKLYKIEIVIGHSIASMSFSWKQIVDNHNVDMLGAFNQAKIVYFKFVFVWIQCIRERRVRL